MSARGTGKGRCKDARTCAAQRTLPAEPGCRARKVYGSALDVIWLREAERRLAAYRKGLVQGIPTEDIFGKL